MTDTTHGEQGWNRRQMLKAAGTAAVMTGLAGCETKIDTSPTDGSGGSIDRDAVPVYEVTATGASADAVETLATELELPSADVLDEFGVVQHLDPESYLYVPLPDGEPETIEDEDSPEGREVTTQFDPELVEAHPEPPAPDAVLDRFLGALDVAGLAPDEDFPGSVDARTTHATFELDDVETEDTVLRKDLDTAVGLTFDLDGIPLEGPGAKIRARFTNLGDEIVVSDVRHAFRELEEGPEVELLAPSAVNDRFRETLDATIDAEEVELMEPRLVYRAPDLRRHNDNPIGEGEYEVQTLLPHYEVGGTATIAGEEVTLHREYVPATNDADYVPDPTIEVASSGAEVHASVEIEGGQPPYKVEWTAGETVAPTDTDGDPDEVELTVEAREPVEETTVTATVTDANGVSVTRRERVPVESARVVTSGGSTDAAAAHGASTDAAAATTPPGNVDVGLEASIWPDWARKFVNVASAFGYDVHFTWTKNAVWENDFTEPTDNDYGVDTADLVYEVGHGNPRGFTPGNDEHDDGFVSYTDAEAAWGDYDLDWLVLHSCDTLTSNHRNCDKCDGKSRAQRWWRAFDGLHQLHGFQMFGIKNEKFPKYYALYAMGDTALLDPLPMYKAWLLAVDNYQPDAKPDHPLDNRGVTMGPMDRYYRHAIFDYFHGHGPLGPDIPHEAIRYVWSIVGGG